MSNATSPYSSYVLMLPRWYPNAVDNADGNFIQHHIECIASNRKAIVLFAKAVDTIPGNDIRRPEFSNIENHIIYYKARKGFLSSVFNTIKHFQLLKRKYDEIEKKHGRAILCHVHVVGRNGFFALYLKLTKTIPYVLSEHWSALLNESPEINPIKKYAYRFIYNKAGAISSVSDSLKKGIQRICGGISIDIIPNVINDVFLHHDVIEPKPSVKKLIHISNLNLEIKQSDKMLECLNEIASERNDFGVILIGDGSDRDKVERLSSKLTHLSGRLIFTGDIPPSEIAQILSDAHATISFSKFETQSIVLLESIAMNVPVVAPCVGGIPEHCTNRGILFNVNDRSSFKKGIQDILDDKDRFVKAEMRPYVQSIFSCESIKSKFEDLYSKAKTNVQ